MAIFYRIDVIVISQLGVVIHRIFIEEQFFRIHNYHVRLLLVAHFDRRVYRIVLKY